MRKIAHKTALHIIGWFFIGLGIVGLILPIMPGIIFFALGIYILSLGWLWLYLKIEKIKLRFPHIAFHYDKFDAKIGKIIKKVH